MADRTLSIIFNLKDQASQGMRALGREAATLKRAFANLGDSGTLNGIYGIGRALSDASSEIGGLKNDIAGASGVIDEWASRGVGDIEDVRQGLLGVGESIDQIDRVKSAFDLSDLSFDFEGLGGNIVDVSKTIKTDLVSALDTARKQGEILVGSIGEMAPPDISNFENFFSDFEIGMLDAIEAITHSRNAKAMVDNALDLAIEALENAGPYGKIIAMILSILRILSKELPGQLYDAVKGLLVRAIQELPLTIANFQNEFLTPLINMIPKIIEGFNRNLPLMFAGIIKGMPDLIAAILKLVFTQELTIMVVKSLYDSIDEAFKQWVGGGYQDWKDDFASMMSDAGEALAAPFYRIWEIVKDWGEKVGKGFEVGGTIGEVIDSFAIGTDYVPRTGIYQLHRGEAVIPAAQNIPARSLFSSAAPPSINVVVNLSSNFDSGGGDLDLFARRLREVIRSNFRGLGDDVRRAAAW